MAPISDRLIPILLERGKEKRAEKKRQQRITKVTNLMGVVQGDNPLEKKRKAAAELAALGVSVPRKLYTKSVDFAGLMKPFNIKDKELLVDLQYAIDQDEMTVAEAYQWAIRAGETPKKLTLEEITRFKEEGVFDTPNNPFKDKTPEQIFAKIRVGRRLSGIFGVEGAASILGGGAAPGKVSTTQEKINIFQKATTNEQGQQLHIEEILGDEQRMGRLSAAGFTREEILESFNVNPAAIVDAERAIQNEIVLSNMFFKQALPGSTLPDFVEAYAGGNEDAFVGDSKIKRAGMDIVKKFYTRSGVLKPELVMDRANKTLQLAIDNSNLFDLKAEEIPLKFQPIIQKMLEYESDSGETVTKAKVREWMLQDKKLPGYSLTPEEENQILEYFPE